MGVLFDFLSNQPQTRVASNKRQTHAELETLLSLCQAQTSAIRGTKNP